MNEFKCDITGDTYNEKLVVEIEENNINITIHGVDGSEYVVFNPNKARELAVELNRLADELDGVYRHDEIRGTMLCSSLVIPIKPKP